MKGRALLTMAPSALSSPWPVSANILHLCWRIVSRSATVAGRIRMPAASPPPTSGPPSE